MNKIGLIIWREYLTRVRKKSFIIMTILGPVLFAALIVLPGWLATLDDNKVQEIAVVEYDRNGQPVPASEQFFRDVIPNKDNIKFTYLDNAELPVILKAFEASSYDGVLFLQQSLMSAGQKATVEFYYREPPGVGLETHISKSLEKVLFNNRLLAKNIPSDFIESLETNINLTRINWKNWPNKQEDTTDIKRGIGYVSGFLIYMFIFMFGAQVMRGILEEKTSRIVEVIISSVKPFQLMMGKVVGIGLIALTQFVIWLVLTAGITFVTKTLITPAPAKIATEQQAPANLMSAEQQMATEQIAKNQVDESMVNNLIDGLANSNIVFVVIAFLFYFLGGYLLYGSLFAAIGAAVDSEADTQQFMLPITIPLILALFVMINSFLNPSGQLAIWFSMIPLTSPIVMMARIPFGVPPGQLILSMTLLVATFIFTIWLAAKFYRTGILMYGKKVSYAELWKWIRY